MRFLDLSFPDIAMNLAMDEALLLDAEENAAGPTLRIWEQSHPCVVLGASGRINEDVNREACKLAGIPIARRSSGGGTVIIGPGALNIAMVLPVAASPDFAAVDLAQKAVLGQVARSLNTLVSSESDPLEVLGSADLAIGRRKCSGSAQRRLKHHFLVHASLLYDFPLSLIGRCLFAPRRQPEYREGRSHDTFVTNFVQTRVSLVEALRSGMGASEDPGGPTQSSLKLASELVETKLARPDWIERL